MNRNADSLPGSYRSPWTLRVFQSLPGHPLWKGSALALALLTIFFGCRALFVDAGTSTADDLRIAVTQILILILVYCATAYAWVLVCARKTTEALRPIAQELPHWQMLLDRAGKHPWWLLPVLGAANVLLVGVPVTQITTPSPVDPWNWQSWHYDVAWHRATMVFFVWLNGCFCYVAVIESLRLSRLTEEIAIVDLLHTDPYEPLVRQGLTNALLIIGVVSALSLLAVEPRYIPVLIGLWIAFIILALIGMMLPLRGIRKRLEAARRTERDWCLRQFRESRDALKSGAGGARLAEIAAYRALIEGSKTWPFDSSTLVRFVLYLLIPLGSWLGGAIVERMLDAMLS